MLTRTAARRTTLGTLLVGVEVLAAVACGSVDPPESVETVQEDATSTAAASHSGSREFSPIDLCQLLPLSDVAAAVERDPSSAKAEATLGTWSADCTYTFKHQGLDDYVMVWVYSARLWAPMEDTVLEELPGLGDAAYRSEAGTLPQVNVLVGDVYFDTRAREPGAARRLAELAVAKYRSR